MAFDVKLRPNKIPWPPLLVLAAFLAALPLQYFFPTGGLLPDWLRLAGRGLAALGVGLDFWAMATMALARTNIFPHRAADRLVTRGPFAFTRNPIYLGNTMLIIGIGLSLSLLWLLPFAFVAAALTQKLAILREEAHLASLFPDQWPAYAARTPRWLKAPWTS